MRDNKNYINAPATKMLASHCIFCGAPLVDAVSVETGCGSECRRKIMDCDGGIADDVRVKANELVYRAAIAAQNGEISTVKGYAEQIKALGLDKLADKVGRRFRNAERNTEIVLTLEGECYKVETPFRRGAKEEFIAAWRKIPGRRYKDGANFIPVVQKKALFELLKQFFAGKIGNGPKGLFRIPEAAFKPENGELPLTVGEKQ
jgi:hypothetical protein